MADAVEIPQALFDYTVKQQIRTGRYASKVVRDIIGLLNKADAEILDKISRTEAPFSKARLQALLKEIRTTLTEIYSEAGNDIKQQMLDFAGVQAEATAAMLAIRLPVSYNIIQATAEQLKAIVDTAPVTVGPDKKLLLEEIFTSLAAGKEEAIRGSIRLGMVEGETTSEMVRRLKGTRAAQYKDGVLEVSRRHAEAMVRTICNHTSNQAMQSTYKNNAEVVKGWTFVATLDGRTSISCASLSGSKWPVGQGPIPPRHPNCLPGDSIVTPVGKITAVSKRWYDGNMVIVKTASGKVFAATPNHPILTPSGWVAVGLLDVGGDIISHNGVKLASPDVDGNHKQIPSRIEDVAEAFLNHSEVLSVPVETSPKHFHGDGAGSKVTIIGANRELWLSGDTSFNEHIHKLPLVFGNNFASRVRSIYQGLVRYFDAPDSIMRRLGKSLSFICCHAAHAGNLLLTPVTCFDTVLRKQALDVGGGAANVLDNSPDTDSILKQFFRLIQINFRRIAVGLNAPCFQDPMDRTCSDSVFIGNLPHSHAGNVIGNNNVGSRNVGAPSGLHAFGTKDAKNRSLAAIKFLGNICHRLTSLIKPGHFFAMGGKPHLPLFGLASNMDAPLFEHSYDDIAADAKLASEISSGSTGEVFADKIIDIAIKDFHGHVYNLQTESNWYIAQGIVSHNCRSVAIPDLKTWRELGVDLDEMPAGMRSSKDGPVKADISFQDWLKGQDKATQVDILGSSRQKLFAAGTPIDRFTDSKGRVLTLEQLKSK